MRGTTIVGSSGSEAAAAAADWAAERARVSGGDVSLVRVVGPVGRETEGDVVRRVTGERVGLDVEAARMRTGSPGLVTVVDVVPGDPAEVLRAFSSPTTVLVLGSPARSRGDRSVVDRIVSTASGPVALVPVRPDLAEHAVPVTGIVVGVDGTDASLSALAFAADEAARWGEPLEAVHAWLDVLPLARPGLAVTDVVSPRDPGRWEVDPQTALLRFQHEMLLHDSVAVIASSHPGVVIHERVVQGDPARVLLEAARSRRCLVVGSHGRRRIARFLLGSVSRAAVLAVPVPTIVVPTTSGDEKGETEEAR